MSDGRMNTREAYDRVMQRYPKTMAHLAEAEKPEEG